ncbi:AraC family transcriptional regulator [Lichenihabitans psoromatis]|uniref:AraC family transcriptional regulator n=1 Tax=Lichenihabitans psoromatis TaxID=2528642 RepID=UPI001036675A|nr:AraC family transcriptional regulator [Lichenihabitans psoromatis]
MPRTADRIRLVRDASSGVEAIRARFGGHAYDMHRHDEWLVGVTDFGVQEFFCRGARRRSTTGRVILIEPEEMHDGQAGAEDGFAYRMLYLPRAWLRAGLTDTPDADPAFRATLSDDDGLATAIRRACTLLAEPSPRLARDAGLDAVLDRLRPHLGRSAPGAQALAPRVAARARERLHDRMTDEIGADDLARAAGAADRFQLSRTFRAAYGTSPHAYLVQIRLTEARRLLLAGERPAAVAAACGFADQSHLGRWFRRAYGVTPAAYRACCTGVPDMEAYAVYASGLERPQAS